MSIILVTGANRGIGYAIVQAIASRQPSSTIILASRNENSATEAIQQLRAQGVSVQLGSVELDIEKDATIEKAVNAVEEKYGKLDVLINNAAKVDLTTSTNLADIRAASNATYNNIITSNAIVTQAFSRILRKSAWPRVIMVSSARGSIYRTVNKQLPVVTIPQYCISKVGLNMLTIHLQAAEDNNKDGQAKITYWAVSPGHCKTAFNGYRGVKDPLDGAESVVRLLESQRDEVEPGTFWEFEEAQFRQVPW